MEQMQEIEKIRARYTDKEVTKMDELRALDQKVKRPADIFAYIYGTLSALILGTGMCFAMKVIGSSMTLGIIVGLLGIGLALTTYPLYESILRKRKQKYAEQILALSNELLHR